MTVSRSVLKPQPMQEKPTSPAPLSKTLLETDHCAPSMFENFLIKMAPDLFQRVLLRLFYSGIDVPRDPKTGVIRNWSVPPAVAASSSPGEGLQMDIKCLDFSGHLSARRQRPVVQVHLVEFSGDKMYSLGTFRTCVASHSSTASGRTFWAVDEGRLNLPALISKDQLVLLELFDLGREPEYRVAWAFLQPGLVGQHPLQMYRYRLRGSARVSTHLSTAVVTEFLHPLRQPCNGVIVVQLSPSHGPLTSPQGAVPPVKCVEQRQQILNDIKGTGESVLGPYLRGSTQCKIPDAVVFEFYPASGTAAEGPVGAYRLALSPCGRYLAVALALPAGRCSQVWDILLYDLERAAVQAPCSLGVGQHFDKVVDLDWSSEHRLFSAGADGVVNVWKISVGRGELEVNIVHST
jgi:hypothetical protein